MAVPHALATDDRSGLDPALERRLQRLGLADQPGQCLVMSGLLGLAIFYSQRRELQYDRIVTENDAGTNFQTVRAALQEVEWRITSELPNRQLDAQTADSRFTVGERVQIRFAGSEVLVASICDPSVGFSLVGRRRCAEHRALVREAVLQSGASSRSLTAET